MAAPRTLPRIVALAGIIGFAAACAPAEQEPLSPLPTDEAAVHEVHVVSNGWHTGIVIARQDLPDGLVPEAADFPEARFLEFGWGDRAYYPNPRASVAEALSAGLRPTPAVIHLAGLDAPPRAAGRIEVVTLAVTPSGLERMMSRIDATFERDGEGPAPAMTAGLYPHSLFYAAHGRFHLFNTCNTWVARKLAAAGVPVRSSGVVTAADIMDQIRNRE